MDKKISLVDIYTISQELRDKSKGLLDLTNDIEALEAHLDKAIEREREFAAQMSGGYALENRMLRYRADNNQLQDELEQCRANNNALRAIITQLSSSGHIN